MTQGHRRPHAPRPRAPRAARLAPLALLAALLALLAAAACGGGGEAERDASAPAAPAGGAVTTATPAPAGARGADLAGEDLEVARWGDRVCELTREFAERFLASGDSRDPGQLPLAERRERAGAMFPLQFGAVDAALGALALIEPPERIAGLHQLLRQTYEGLHDALRDQQAIIGAADTAEAIAFSNLDVNEWIGLALRQAALLANAGYCPSQ